MKLLRTILKFHLPRKEILWTAPSLWC